MTTSSSPPERAPHARWRARPVLSTLLRVAVFVMPICAALLLSYMVGRVVPRPRDAGGAALWWLGFVAVEILAFLVFQRLAQRLIPLATLLRLSLIFPDRAPSRFAVARRRVRDLEAETSWLRRGRVDDAPARATETIVTLVAALTAHDRATRGHSERVRIFTDMLAEELRLPAEARDRLRWAALLHDIGKLTVPAGVLNKRGDPGPEGWQSLRRHPSEGAKLIEPIRDWLGEWALAVEQHHERWNGRGYPRGLRGREISLGARIVAVVDAFETMTAARAYKRPMSVSAARRELVRSSGTHLDPTIVRAFLSISIGRLWRTVGITAWLAPLAGAPLGLLPRMLPAGTGAGAVTALVTTGTVALHPAVLPPAPPPPPVASTPAGHRAVVPSPGRPSPRASAVPVVTTTRSTTQTSQSTPPATTADTTTTTRATTTTDTTTTTTATTTTTTTATDATTSPTTTTTTQSATSSTTRRRRVPPPYRTGRAGPAMVVSPAPTPRAIRRARPRQP